MKGALWMWSWHRILQKLEPSQTGKTRMVVQVNWRRCCKNRTIAETGGNAYAYKTFKFGARVLIPEHATFYKTLLSLLVL